MALNAGCFAAGTKLLTRAGWRNIEDIRPGEEVLSRPDSDPTAAPEWKPVEERFERFGPVLHLHFPGAERIRTTTEHPFWVQDQGWTPAGALAEGDRVATLSGEWVPVTEVFDTGEWEPLFNLRVADHHTYFVGEETWGWAAWAHNTYSHTWMSGLKVAEQVQLGTGRVLAEADKNTILWSLRSGGLASSPPKPPTSLYGSVGDQEALISLLTYELAIINADSEAPFTPSAATILNEYLRNPDVTKWRKAEEAKIQKADNRSFKIPGSTRTVRGFVAVIYNDLSNVDARDRSYDDYSAEVGPRPRNPVHGHHIVYKGGQAGVTWNASAEGRDILLYHGINPYWGKENLAYAPNPGSHSGQEQVDFVALLRAEFNGANRKSEIIWLLVLEAERWVKAYK